MKSLFDPNNPLIQSLADRRAELKPIRALWQQVVGKPVYDHSQPVDLDQNGVLTIWVDSSLWATQLRHQGPSVVAKIKSHGVTQVDSLSIRVMPAVLPQADTRNHPIHHPVSTGTTKLLSSTAHSLADKDLRTSLLRLCATLKGTSKED